MSRILKISLLVFFLALCGIAAVIPRFRPARGPAPAAKELFSVVNRQISALCAADFDGAYRYDAVGIQQKFSRRQFELMIRRDFSSMTEAQRVEFGAVQVADTVALLQVFITTPDGVMRGFLYSFTEERGGWKINGVKPIVPQHAHRPPGLHI